MPALTIKDTLHPRGPAGALVLSSEQLAKLGADRKSPPVRVTVNGHTFEGRVASRGGELLIGFNQAVREACGIEVGDSIEATIELDDEPRVVELPQELTAALADAGVRDAFDTWSHTRRKEAARSVADAKQEATRERRVAKVLEELR